MALEWSSGWPLHANRNLFRNNSIVCLHGCFVHSLENLQKTSPSLHPMNTMDFIRSVSSFMCCNYIPPGSIRIYCPLIKMSTENVTFWPQEDDFCKILFFIVV